MEPRKNEKREPKQVHLQEQKPKLRIVKLESRIAPALTSNHNETLVRERAKAVNPGEEKPISQVLDRQLRRTHRTSRHRTRLFRWR